MDISSCVALVFIQFPMVKPKGGLKPATAINVRHILCEKHSKVMDALGKLQVSSLRVSVVSASR